MKNKLKKIDANLNDFLFKKIYEPIIFCKNK